jgi:hypothetical protein
MLVKVAHRHLETVVKGSGELAPCVSPGCTRVPWLYPEARAQESWLLVSRCWLLVSRC